MKIRLALLALALAACSSPGGTPLIRGSLKPEDGKQPQVEKVAVLRVKLSERGLDNDYRAYGEAGCSWLLRHDEASALLYLITVPKNTYGEHPEVIAPFAVHRSQCV